MKPMTSKQMFESIKKDIKGMTHDIVTLEAMAKKFLDTALEVRSLRQELSTMKGRMKNSFECKFHHVECDHKCELKKLIDRDER